MRRALLILVAALAASVPLASGASTGDATRPVASRVAKEPDVRKSPDLWATINVCDTAARPDTIGIRGSMPGLRRTSRLLMRFRVQYLPPGGTEWKPVQTNADSGWKKVGRLKRRVVEAGQNFSFEPPAAGGAHRLRGVVHFKWVRKRKVVERARRVTEAGHRSTAGADPEGYSAAVCDIT